MQIETLAAIAIAAVLAVLAPVTLYLDSTLGGWRALADKYPGLPKRPAPALRLWARFVWLENGGSSYPGVVVIIHRDGLQLEMQRAMRLFYPPMFLPWKDLVVASRTGIWLFERVQLTFAQTPNEPISVNARVWNRVLDFVGPVAEPKAGLWAGSAVAQKPAAG